MDGSQLVCQASTGQENDWKDLYEQAFPADERHPVEDLRKSIANGNILLHKTTNKSGELLCFSITNLMSNFSFLAYIATDSTKRSTGVGSKHMKRLIELLKQAYPNHLALFLEIESTKEIGLDAETQKARNRRLAFYQRLGAKRLHQTYLMPSYGSAHGTQAAREGELMWVEFQTSCITEETLLQVIEEIFCKGYGVAKSDPVVQKVLAQFNNANKTKCGGKSETAATGSTNTQTSTASAGESAAQPAPAPPPSEAPAGQPSPNTEPSVAGAAPPKPSEPSIAGDVPPQPSEPSIAGAAAPKPSEPAPAATVTPKPAEPATVPSVSPTPSQPASAPAPPPEQNDPAPATKKATASKKQPAAGTSNEKTQTKPASAKQK